MYSVPLVNSFLKVRLCFAQESYSINYLRNVFVSRVYSMIMKMLHNMMQCFIFVINKPIEKLSKGGIDLLTFFIFTDSFFNLRFKFLDIKSNIRYIRYYNKG